MCSDKYEKKTYLQNGKEVTNPFKTGGSATLAFMIMALLGGVAAAALAGLMIVDIAIPGLTPALRALALLAGSGFAAATGTMAWILYAGIVYGSESYKQKINLGSKEVSLHASYSYFFCFIAGMLYIASTGLAFLVKQSADAYREI